MTKRFVGFLIPLLLLASPAWAVTQASLTSGGSSTNASSYDTASITPSANKLIIVAVGSNDGEDPPQVPTISGNGLTYVQIDNQIYDTNRKVVTLFRSMGSSPTTGAITIDFSADTQAGCTWSVMEFGDVNTGGTNGSGAVVQSAKNSVSATTSITVTLAAFGNTANGAMAGFSIDNDVAITPDTGWTEVHEVLNTDGADSNALETQWRSDNDTTAVASWTGNLQAAGIAIEIKDVTADGAARRVIIISKEQDLCG